MNEEQIYLESINHILQTQDLEGAQGDAGGSNGEY